jgi:hypothetical protein
MANTLKEIFAYSGAIIGIAAFGIGLYQYYRAQIWKKSEFAAAQIQRLTDDPALALCCIFLD